MKKLLVSLLTIASIFSLSACNNSGASDSSSSSTSQSTSSRTVGPVTSSSTKTSTTSKVTNNAHFETSQNEDGTLTITRYTYDDNTEPATCKIPSSINGKTVTAIGERCFFYASGITSVEIPATITSIDEKAFGECITLSNIVVEDGNKNFAVEGGVLYNKEKTTLIYCPALLNKDITMPSTVTSIGGYSFYGSRLRSHKITWSDKVTTIGDFAFYKSDIATITLPDSVTSCGEQAFAYSYVTSLHLSSSLNKIGSLCLTFLQYLKELTVPGSLKVIETQTISNNVRLEKLVLEEGVEELEKSALEYNKVMKNVTFPSTLKKIGKYACSYFGYVENLVIPEGVEEIADEAFIYGENLATVSLPASLKQLGEGAFAYSQKLYQITLNAESTSFTLDDGVLYTKDKTRLLCYPSRLAKDATKTSYSVSEGTTQIDATAFAYSTYLKTLSLPSTINRIGYSCLYESSIRTLNIDMSEEEWDKVTKTQETTTSSDGSVSVYSEWNTNFSGTINYKAD